MAINNYTGLQGSGKSYEVVSTVILDALAAGRRVVTNIAGIDANLIRCYLLEKRDISSESQGSLVLVSDEQVRLDTFFPDEKYPDLDSVVKGGDLVCIDEAWQFWGKEFKLSENHMQFFRMHRHYTNPNTGVTCDLAIMTQDATGIHPKLLNVVEMTTLCTKMKALGAPTSYRIEIYQGKKVMKKARLDVFVKKYKKEYFPLYKSYAAGAGVETAMDKRQNVLMNPRLWFIAVLVVFAVTMGPYFVWRSLINKKSPDTVSSSPDSVTTPLTAQQTSHSGLVVSDQGEVFSDDWRIVGRVSSGVKSYVVMSDGVGHLRVESPSMFTNDGYAQIGNIGGKKVTVFSGMTKSGSAMPLEGKK
ncbi:zonular occludens toxin domain-containing protein [Herbaspirillum sp. NPDC101397]|uniref:zonular occludens toxin domain-containing protein n=1 Tax=Herbaspirillum sp. NPDC101397 TaxID=3364006 RepID=UPI003839E1FD